MNKKWSVTLCFLMMFVLIIAPAASAFTDISNDPAEVKIRALQEKGIVSGINEQEFSPQGHMSYAQGVHLIVKAMDLNLGHLKFIKEPKASDYFNHIPDDAWYAQSFLIAQLNGLPLDKDVDPSVMLTREQFAELLFKAIELTGEYYFIDIYMILNDEDQVDKNYMSSIQRLLIAKIASTDDNGNFRPKDNITRSEASSMIYEAIRFVDENKDLNPVPPVQDQEVELITEKVTEEVNKAIVSWGMKGNPGYRVSIDRIEFKEDEAIVYYSLHEPDPDQMYPQVITEAKAETYVDSKYTIVLQPNPNASTSNSSSSSASGSGDSSSNGQSTPAYSGTDSLPAE
ncbi:S-layer homology domain-containing protein [Paenibacillus sp. J2TS4]|uniref:S-layer homology domain-containing protein n=1 Tax=Paenibacillus sp. J2TS4 TaxID=2807194 RepID=UPI001B16937C|nr:S-layer homology domain-containing protein [Paenibacillus sp. J2TS4]GIP36422.1 hypothetical protein J2TS4_56320 [Paenibacillus sp. J2TS4]